MTRNLRATALSLDVTVGDLDANFARIAQTLAALDECGPHLVVLPELATSGYVFTDVDEAGSLAVRDDDPRLTGLADLLPPNTVVVLGFCERDGDTLYNSAAVLTRHGMVGCYRKAHLWDAEHTVFTPGDRAGTVVDTDLGRIGVAICYDSEFPELPRRLALLGAEVLALPVNWPLVPRPAGEHAPETVQAMAAARSSKLPVVIADRHGTERGVRWTGGTAVISADGWICAAEQSAATALIDLDRDTALGPFNDVFTDRRPELYTDVAIPHHPATEKREAHVR